MTRSPRPAVTESAPGPVGWAARMALAARVLVCAMPALFVIGKAPPDVALSMTAALFLAHSAVRGEWSWLRTPWVVAASCLWLYLIAVGLAAEDAGGALGRAGPWIRFVVFAAAVQFWVLADGVWRKRLLICTGAVLAFVSADTFFQFYFSYDIFGIEKYSEGRLTGPMPDSPPKVGVFVLRLMFPVLLALAGWAAAGGRRLGAGAVAAAAVGLGVTTVLISGERMAFILALFGVAVALLLAPAVRRVLLAAAVAAGVLVAGFVTFSDSVSKRSFESSISKIGGFWESDYGQIWLGSLEVAGAHPVFGVGLRNYRTACPDAVYRRSAGGGAADGGGGMCSLHPHNIYLEWLSEAGVVGLAGFLGLIGLWARHFAAGARVWRRDAAAAGPVVAVIVFLWPIAGTMGFFANWHAALFWLVLGWALAATGGPRPAPEPAGETAR